MNAGKTRGYTLVICENPDAARRVAEALSKGAPEMFRAGGVSAFRLQDPEGARYVVCAASGHLYGLFDTVRERRVYPTLDLEWFPLQEKAVASRINAIRSLSTHAGAFVNACDFDIEGETIGYNILKYACQGKEGSASRARFSALTKDEVLRAFRAGDLSRADGLAKAGRLRHAIDFVWGVNLSRALSESVRTGRRFRQVTIGRVQGPTLAFAVDREVEVETFVSVPYWTVLGTFKRGGGSFQAKYSPRVVRQKSAAEEVKLQCEGKTGVVSRVSTKRVSRRPPPPLNLADIQKEAFSLYGYAPSQTLRLAEKLYLAALISYPRTASQRLPRLDHGALLSNLARIPRYSGLVSQVLSRGVLEPIKGEKTDPAHPAIYPTGEIPRRPLAPEEDRIFDLVVRRFLSCFGEEAVDDVTSIEVSVGDNLFDLEESRRFAVGWTKFMAGGVAERAAGSSPPFLEGEAVPVDHIWVEEHFRARPPRYNQATLLEKMEREGIGTKATRADVISTLLARGYLTGGALVPTELGLALVDTMRDHCPQIISTGLTRDVETELERIERSEDSGGDFYEETLGTLVRQIGELRVNESDIATGLGESFPKGSASGAVLGRCPICREGQLRVVRSRKSGKRFVGCSRYQTGCKASAPLPQRGTIRAAPAPCNACGWPVVRVWSGRRPWRLCVNDRCPRKVNPYAMQKLQRARPERVKGGKGRAGTP